MKASSGLRAATSAIVAFLLAPIILIAIVAFSSASVQTWPIPGISLRWFAVAFTDREVLESLRLSLEVASLATALAIILGLLSALAVHRMTSGWKEAVSFALVLPLALPGILTGMALNAYFATWQIALGFATIVIAHATFCIVIVYNNVIARLRRLPPSLLEASADLGAGPLQTFARVTLPLSSGAILAGALLAFALSFDEVIVTTFTAGVQTTLPLWILGAIRLGQKLPEVNVVVLVVILVTLIPVLAAQRLLRQTENLRFARDKRVRPNRRARE